MKASRRSPWGFESMLSVIAALPDEQKTHALLHLLQNVLSELPAATLRRKRARFIEHFAQCECSYDVCSAVQELVDLHLAQQSQREPEDLPRTGPKPGDSRGTHSRF